MAQGHIAPNLYWYPGVPRMAKRSRLREMGLFLC